jgi:single-strand DNA-binding protein
MSIYNENEIRITGILSKDPEVRTTTQGKSWAKLSIPTTRRWKDQGTGQSQEHTEWHTVVVNGRDAENARDYLTKGSYVTVKGEMRYRKWEDNAGNQRISAEIHANEIGYLDRAKSVASRVVNANEPSQNGTHEPAHGDPYADLDF